MSPSTAEVNNARQVTLEHSQAVLDELLGEGKAESQIASASDFTRPGIEYLQRSCFGGIWDRPGLEKRYRSLTVISILAATGKIAQLKSHVRLGLSNGLKEEEIRECLLHVMGYCGFPAGLDAFAAADEVIKASKA